MSISLDFTLLLLDLSERLKTGHTHSPNQNTHTHTLLLSLKYNMSNATTRTYYSQPRTSYGGSQARREYRLGADGKYHLDDGYVSARTSGALERSYTRLAPAEVGERSFTTSNSQMPQATRTYIRGGASEYTPNVSHRTLETSGYQYQPQPQTRQYVTQAPQQYATRTYTREPLRYTTAAQCQPYETSARYSRSGSLLEY